MAAFTLAQSGRDNNFNLIRFLAAMAVIISHAVLLSTGNGEIEPLRSATGYSLGDHAVNVFFVLSGFLVAKSLLTRRDLIAYGASRMARVLPGLFVAALVTAFVIGPIATSMSLSEYFSAISVWLYAPLIGTLATDPLNVGLPGVFATTPFPDIVNGPLWTIRYEVMAYGALLLVALAGVFATKLRFAIFFAGATAGLIAWQIVDPFHPGPTALDHLARLGFSFLLGTAAYVLRDHLKLSLLTVVLLLVITWLLAGTTFYRGALYFFTAAAVLWFAQTPGGPVRQFNKLGDYSYGLYIYGWPVAQTLIALNPALSPTMLFALGAPITLVLAILSWHLVEKPILARRAAFAGFINGLIPDIALFKFLKSPLG